MTRIILVTIATLILPSSFSNIIDTDWRGEFMAPIGDQASCDSCVAFAVGGALEWYVARTTGTLIPLSYQYLVDCSVDADTGQQENGCQAGTINTEIKQIMRDQYLPYDTDYPFSGDFDSERCADMGARDHQLRNALADVWVHDYVPLTATAQSIRTALQTGPTIHGMYTGEDLRVWKGQDLFTDSGCTHTPHPHAMVFVGWQSNGGGDPYYIVRNSYGTDYGYGGYLNYADNIFNEYCRYTTSAYSLLVGPRREVEYLVGEGKRTFKDARKWCQEQGSGWDLAHIPTEMHNFQVYDLFTERYGNDKKPDATFNYFWIGLFNARNEDGSDRWVWVEGDYDIPNSEITGHDAKYSRFTTNNMKNRFAAINKIMPQRPVTRGVFTDKAASTTLRFMCSRYRSEECPRFSQTSVNRAHSVTFLHPGVDDGETLDIVEGVRVRVRCMEGYTPLGGEGVCENGSWRDIPICFSETPCEVMTHKDIKKAKDVKIEGVVSGGFADEGSTMTIECKNGFEVKLGDSSAPTVCEKGKWENMPKCSKIKTKNSKKEKTKKQRQRQ